MALRKTFVDNMAIAVAVGLLSGKTASVKAGLDEEVEILKRRAQTALGVGRGRLLNSSGSFLDVSTAIKHAGLQNGDSLLLHINKVQIEATEAAFAAILGDGSVVTWGDPDYGGDSSAVRDKLKNVRQVLTAFGTFAALLGDGSVVTWGFGDVTWGFGDDRAGQDRLDRLKHVQQIRASSPDPNSFIAFAAIACRIS